MNCFYLFSQITKKYLHRLSKMDRELMNNNSLLSLYIEYETKIIIYNKIALKFSLNNMFLIIINNIENQEFKNEFISGMYSIEYNSFLTIKLSLDLAIVPIKK